MKQIKVRDISLFEGGGSIAIPITAKCYDELIQQLQMVDFDDIDLIEWRVDHYEAFLNYVKVDEALQGLRQYLKNKPLIATFRTLWEGGVSAIEKANYISLVKHLITQGEVDIIDLELYFLKEDELLELITYARSNNVLIILSNHNFEKTLGYEDLLNRFMVMDKYDCDFMKIAMMPKTSKDVINMMQVSNRTNELSNKLVISMSMGDIGKASRVCCSLSKSCLTFGCYNESSAPGQIQVHVLKNMIAQLSNI